ncbi:hypothetical protein R6Q59_014938 [Mikania micrantha]
MMCVIQGNLIIHNVKLLSEKEAICLFSRCAFEREIPYIGYEELSKKVVRYADGLPLTIKVLGPFLCGRPESDWKDAIERLKGIPLKEILEKLELSYNRLDNDQKEIFLDVACALKGKKKDEAIRVLESFGFHAKIGLRVLEEKSLITISIDGCLGLHNHMEEMGRNIVHRLHPDEPQQHSRLWIKEEIETVLTDNLGTKATRSIKLLNTNLSPYVIMNGLRKMTKLRFIHIDGGFVVDDGFVNNAYPFNSSIPESLIYIYIGVIIHYVLNKLRFLHLKNSRLKTFDLDMTDNLETLNLRNCRNNVELHMTITLLNLKILDLLGSNVRNLNLSLTPHLEKLTLSLKEDTHLPENMCTLKLLD